MMPSSTFGVALEKPRKYFLMDGYLTTILGAG